MNLGELDFHSTAANGAIAGPLVIGTGIFGSGTVKYLASSQVPSTTDVTVNNNSTLNLNGFSDTINDLTVTGGLVSLPAGSSLTAAGLTMTGGNINTGTGSTFTLGGDATINDSPGGLTIDGTGSLVLGGSPTTFTVNTTTPAIGLNISVPIGGTGGLTMTGGGTMELSASSANTYTGTTTVNNGTLELNGSNTVAAIPGALVVGDGTDTALVQEKNFSQIASTSDATVNAHGTLDFNGYDDVLGSMTVDGGSVTVGGAFVTLGGGLTMTGGSITTESNGNFRIGTGGVTTDASSTTATISGVLDLGNATQTFTIAKGTTSSGVNLDISATIYDGGVSKTGSGTMALDGSNTYTGGTTVSAGVLQITNSGALSSGSATVSGTGDLQLVGGTNGISVSNNLTLNSSNSPAVEGVSGPNTLSGTITLGQSATIAVNVGSLLVSGIIGDGGSNYALTETGPGTLQLSAANTYGGGTTVTAGTLQVFNAAATGTTGAVTVDNGAVLRDSASTYNLPSGGLTLDAGATLVTVSTAAYTITGGITLAGDATIDVDSTGSLTAGGAIAGSYGLTSGGTGTLILTGTSTYTGATTVSAGNLEVDGAIAGTGVAVAAGATLSGGGSVPAVSFTGGGTIQPGSVDPSTGILTVASGDLTGGSINFVLDGTTAGTGYDQLSVAASGTLALGGAALGVSFGTGFTPAVGDVYHIVAMQASSTHSGTFDWQGQPLADGATLAVGNTVFQIAYNDPSGDITLTALWHIDTWTGGDIGTSNGWSDGLNWQGGAYRRRATPWSSPRASPRPRTTTSRPTPTSTRSRSPTRATPSPAMTSSWMRGSSRATPRAA